MCCKFTRMVGKNDLQCLQMTPPLSLRFDLVIVVIAKAFGFSFASFAMFPSNRILISAFLGMPVIWTRWIPGLSGYSNPGTSYHWFCFHIVLVKPSPRFFLTLLTQLRAKFIQIVTHCYVYLCIVLVSSTSQLHERILSEPHVPPMIHTDQIYTSPDSSDQHCRLPRAFSEHTHSSTQITVQPQQPHWDLFCYSLWANRQTKWIPQDYKHDSFTTCRGVRVKRVLSLTTGLQHQAESKTNLRSLKGWVYWSPLTVQLVL